MMQILLLSNLTGTKYFFLFIYLFIFCVLKRPVVFTARLVLVLLTVQNKVAVKIVLEDWFSLFFPCKSPARENMYY